MTNSPLLSLPTFVVPEPRDFRKEPPSSPALDPARSPLADMRINVLSQHQTAVRKPLEHLSRAATALNEFVGAVETLHREVRSKEGSLFMSAEQVNLVSLVNFLAPDSLPPAEIERCCSAEKIRILHRIHPTARSLGDLLRSVRSNNPGAASFIAALSHVPDGAALFQEVREAETRRRELKSLVQRVWKRVESTLERLKSETNSSEAGGTISEFKLWTKGCFGSLFTADSVRNLVSPTKPGLWCDSTVGAAELDALRTNATALMGYLKEHVETSLPTLSDYRPKISVSLGRALPLPTVRHFGGLCAEELVLVKYATALQANESSGTLRDDLRASIERQAHSLARRLEPELLDLLLEGLAAPGATGTTWLSPQQCQAVKKALAALCPVKAPPATAVENKSSRPATPPPTSPVRTKVEPPPIMRSTQEILSQVLGTDGATAILSKLMPAPTPEQTELRLSELEQRLGATGHGHCVASLVSTNPRLLTMPEFGEYTTSLTRTLKQIRSSGVTGEAYSLDATPERFASLGELALTAKRIEMRTRYDTVLKELNASGLHGQAIMAVLRYGYFWGGELHFGVRLNGTDKVRENVDRHLPADQAKRVTARDVRDALDIVCRAGIIAEARRNGGFALNRAPHPGARYAEPLGKALEWVIAYPDMRVEF